MNGIGTVPSETFSCLFAEKDEAFLCIRQLRTAKEETVVADGQYEASGDSSVYLLRFRTIVDKYLECPTLLDPNLEYMVQELAGMVQETLATSSEQCSSNTMEKDCIVNRIQRPLSALYSLSKVRGRKYVQRFLPHDVNDVESVWNGLQLTITAQEKAKGNTDDFSLSTPLLWEAVYMLWTWMSALSLVPFDCKVIVVDGNDLMCKIADSCKKSLTDAGPVRDVAAVCLASWLARPDQAARNQMDIFIQWSMSNLSEYCSENTNNSSSDLFRILGILQTLTSLVKIATLDSEMIVQQIASPLWDSLLQLADSVDNNLLLNKYLVKWWTRTCCTWLPTRVAPWRYQRGQRSLLGGNHTPSCDNSYKIQSHLDYVDNTVAEDRDELYLVPDQVEDATGRIIETLSHASTVVRWSAAKGVGRITERLPAPCADDILDEILTLFVDPANDRCWHGACLALAELARRGLLLPRRLGDVVPCISKAAQYDCRRGQIGVGAHVRDAACYTYWAFARAYSPQILQPFLVGLNESILLTSLFDREVNCRRAASAAFQEAVGRQGATNFPHGIDILTTADYFSLGNRTDSYMIIARKIAEFKEHQQPIIRHLAFSKLYHWDENIRELTAKALSGLVGLDPSYVCKSILPNIMPKCFDMNHLHTRHGAVLGIAEIVLVLSEINHTSLLSDTLKQLLVELVPTIEKKRLFRGRGGEIMRAAVCRFIECISAARLPMNVREQVQSLDSVDANIPHPTQSISEAACRALESLLIIYFPVGEKGPSERLQHRVFDTFSAKARSSDNPAVTRGYTLALGYLPAKLIAYSAEVLTSLVDSLGAIASPKSEVGGEGDAETRRNALISLRRVGEKIGLTRKTGGYRIPSFIDSNLVQQMFRIYLRSHTDYNSDRRGDVGSWCRMVAMEGATELFLEVSADESTQEYLNETDGTALVAILLKQLSERLDTIRQRAGECLIRILLSSKCSHVAHKNDLVLALELSLSDPLCSPNWKDAATVFPNVMKAASVQESLYFESILAGIAFTIGSKGESIGNNAVGALIHWAKEQNCEGLQRLGTSLLRLLKENSGSGRVVLPILKTFDALFSHGCFDLIINQNTELVEELQRSIQKEANCTDISRLFAVVDVTVGLLFAVRDCKNSTSKHAMAFLCTMLIHRFPRTRSYTAEQFYVFLLDFGKGRSAESSERLLNTPWSSEIHFEEIRESVDQIAQELDVFRQFKVMEKH